MNFLHFFWNRSLSFCCHSGWLFSLIEVQSNLAIRNFLVTLKLFLNTKCSLSIWSKSAFGHSKWFLNTDLFLIKPFLITQVWLYLKSDFKHILTLKGITNISTLHRKFGVCSFFTISECYFQLQITFTYVGQPRHN